MLQKLENLSVSKQTSDRIGNAVLATGTLAFVSAVIGTIF